MPGPDIEATSRSTFYRLCDATISLVQSTDQHRETESALSMPGSVSNGETANPSHPQDRRRSTQLPLSPYRETHHRLPRLFSGHVPGVGSMDAGGDDSSDDDDNDSETADEASRSREDFLGRAESYSKLMHAHTHAQLRSPSVSTLPSYTRTMHAFTLNQLGLLDNVTKSANSSPRLSVGSKPASMPRYVCVDVGRLSLDEVPNPANTPEVGHRRLEGRWVRKRSVTEPVPREFAANVARKDFALA
ncbi:hypothetical protein LTR53_001859 [Teratosphaeriaceae sp. CCFEE 6253]|nr:hypothetical protein LTR53_001859 [Teratosphaeriaceae sp. CCFEE 6253]